MTLGAAMKNTEESLSGNGVMKGEPGEKGTDGKSAYQIWLDEGNVGTEQDFLASLKGADGTMTFEDLTEEQKESLKGEQGQDGKSTYQLWLDLGNDGTEEDFLEFLKGENGPIGESGSDGRSAYEIWIDKGNSGTEQDFLDSLKGEKGADGTMTFADLTEEQKESLKGEPGADGTDGESAYDIWLDAGNTGSEEDFLDSLRGEPGDMGESGSDGASAYEIWIDEGNSGTEQDFLDSLKGEPGEKGKDGSKNIDDENVSTDTTWSSEKIASELGGKIYTSLEELGLTAPTTVGDIFNAMPNKSMAVIACEGIEGDTSGAGIEGDTSGADVHVSDVPVSFGVLTIKKGGIGRFSIDYQNSLFGSPCNVKRWIGTLKGNDGTGLVWKEVNTGVKADIPIIENGKDVVQHKITKNRSITELKAYIDRNGNTEYKIDDLYLAYDCEKLAKGIDDWLANKGITPVKGTTYEDVAQIQVYNPSGGGYAYLSTHIKFDNTTYLGYHIKYNDTDYTIISGQYDHTNGKTSTTFYGLNVFNIAKIIPELAGYYIQSDILDVLHNWFELYKPIGLEDSVGLYSKKEALLNQDLTVNTSIDSKRVGAFDLGNIVSLMTSPLQKLLFSVDSEGNNLKAFANDEKKRTTALSNGLFGDNLLAPKNTFATLNDMSTLPTPPDGALGIWTVMPDAAGQPETSNKGGTLIIAHITSDLYSQTVSYIGTRIAIYVTQGAIYYALGYGGKYYPTASWTPASGEAFRWYKISSTLV